MSGAGPGATGGESVHRYRSDDMSKVLTIRLAAEETTFSTPGRWFQHWRAKSRGWARGQRLCSAISRVLYIPAKRF